MDLFQEYLCSVETCIRLPGGIRSIKRGAYHLVRLGIVQILSYVHMFIWSSKQVCRGDIDYLSQNDCMARW
jgi:hypothetical protein